MPIILIFGRSEDMPDVTFLIQGPMHPLCMANIFNYLRHGNVVLSTWDTRTHLLKDGAVKNRNKIPSEMIKDFHDFYTPQEDHKFTMKMHKAPSKRFLHENGVYNYGNSFYQFYTCHEGMKLVDTKYTIKVRTDELYTDVLPLIKKVKEAQPTTLVTTNTFFRKLNKFPWHPSDHVVCGTTQNLAGIFEKALSFCKNGGYFSAPDADRFQDESNSEAYEKFGFHLKREGKEKRWDEWSVSYPTIVPEQLIGASHVLLNHEGVIDFKNHAALMKKYFDIVPVDELGYIMISQSVDSNHRLFDIANTTTIHAVERGHSIEKSMDEIIS